MTRPEWQIRWWVNLYLAGVLAALCVFSGGCRYGVKMRRVGGGGLLLYERPDVRTLYKATIEYDKPFTLKGPLSRELLIDQIPRQGEEDAAAKRALASSPPWRNVSVLMAGAAWLLQGRAIGGTTTWVIGTQPLIVVLTDKMGKEWQLDPRGSFVGVPVLSIPCRELMVVDLNEGEWKRLEERSHGRPITLPYPESLRRIILDPPVPFNEVFEGELWNRQGVPVDTNEFDGGGRRPRS